MIFLLLMKGNGEAMKILLVDDAKFFLELEKTFMRRPNCKILTASNGNEALEIIRRELPDLVLMDLYMPVMDGYDCCKGIKADPMLKDIPVIMVTTAGNDEDIERCLKVGCNDFITKPINRIVLLEKVKKYTELPVRGHARVPVDINATYTHNGKEHGGHISDISLTGLFIECGNRPEVDEKIRVRFNIPWTNILIEGEGVVVRSIAEYATYPSKVVPGVGIRFTDISDFAINGIEAFIEAGNFMI